MRKHILLVSGKRHIQKHKIHHALQTHHISHKRGHGFAGAHKKDVGSFRPAPIGAGTSKKHSVRRLHPLKFKF
jgi:hypothetical protein